MSACRGARSAGRAVRLSDRTFLKSQNRTFALSRYTHAQPDMHSPRQQAKADNSTGRGVPSVIARSCATTKRYPR